MKRYSRLGKKRKKLQKWRRAKGRDNKIREKRKGYGVSPSVGHKGKKTESGKLKGMFPLRVHNISELERAGKNRIIIIGKVGAKKKIEIIKKADEMKFKIANIRREK